MTGVVKVVARTHTQAMEQLQEGYVQAVAATAGVIAEFRRRDLHKYDVELTRQPDVSNEEAAVRLQLKATTTSRPRVGATHLSFTLKSTKDLESLAMERTTIKHILVVMVVGADQHDWTEATHEGLTTRHCCYWVNLQRVPPCLRAWQVPRCTYHSVRSSTQRRLTPSSIESRRGSRYEPALWLDAQTTREPKAAHLST